MKLLAVACVATCLVAAVQHGAQAIEERRGSEGKVGAGFENCVSRDWIHIGSQDQSAILDAADHRLVRAEMIRRYPVIETDGFPSTRTILWQKPTGELLYIAVLDHPAKPGQACFTATFSAHKFDLSLWLRGKYLVPDAPAK